LKESCGQAGVLVIW